MRFAIGGSLFLGATYAMLLGVYQEILLLCGIGVVLGLLSFACLNRQQRFSSLPPDRGNRVGRTCAWLCIFWGSNILLYATIRWVSTGIVFTGDRAFTMGQAIGLLHGAIMLVSGLGYSLGANKTDVSKEVLAPRVFGSLDASTPFRVCPHCGTHVWPKEDGTCPACGC